MDIELKKKLLAIRYGDEGGAEKDGLIELRRGVPGLDLGESHYAQVQILVDGDSYLEGMAVYSDDLPDGVDILFNTNKPSGTPMLKVLKSVKTDKRSDESDWDKWRKELMEVTMGTKDEKKLAINYLKKGYKYVTFDDCHVALWKNRPTYQRVHIGSNDDSCRASTYIWVNTDDNTDDYFGVPESDASIFFSEKDLCLIKPLFEIASGGFSEHIIDCIIDHMNVANMTELKSVQVHLSSATLCYEHIYENVYMIKVTIVTNNGTNSFLISIYAHDPLYDSRDKAHLNMLIAKRCTDFNITDIVKETLESKRISKNLYLKYFTDDEIEWILEHLDNYDDICGIWVKKMSTPHPYTDALAITAFHSSSCGETKCTTGISRLSCMFETLDYYTKYVISESEIQKVIAKGIWYTKHAKD